jgi:nickel-dependent lactate racemase
MTGTGAKGKRLTEADAREICAAEVARWNLRGRRVLVIVPDNTRTAPIDVMFRVLHDLARAEGVQAFDVLVALGTHPPLTDEAINRRMGITARDREERYAGTRFFNHRWDDPGQLVSIGEITEDEVARISGGLMRQRVDVTINRLVHEYDLLLIVGPTFPHEVVGFSGGNKYLFPGIAGKEIIDLFHWLGALITNPVIIGTKHTAVREVVERAAALVPIERKCASLVVEGSALAGLYVGDPRDTWSAAADLSNQIHIVYKDRPFERVLSCAPAMYDELWVAGKCAYKLEPVVADGGELIIYAPHLAEISVTHGKLIRRIGYHVRDYFLAQMDRFADIPGGVLAHSTHVKGVGTFEGGVERPRITVTLATRLSREDCEAINLGYQNVSSIDVAGWKDREAHGLLYVPKAGETLYRLKKDPFHPTAH